MVTRIWITLGMAILAVLAYAVLSLQQRRRATVATRARRPMTDDQPIRPRVLYFRSESCTSCATQSRLFEKLDVSTLELVEKVDADRDRDLVTAYNILTLPTTMVIDVDGQVRHVNYGVVAPQRLQAQLSDL